MQESRPHFTSALGRILLPVGLLLAGDMALRNVHAAPDTVPPKVVTAQEFRLVDKTGAMRASFQTRDDGSPGLALYDKGGKLRVTLQVQADGGSRLAFHDTQNKPRLELEQAADGTGGLILTNSKGSGGAVLLIAPDGGPVAIFKDKDGKVLWSAPEPEVPPIVDPPVKPGKKP